ncbi:MAG: Glucose-1-phosphate thymidylyltransferase [Planctomycetes bacterium ADurb.Bin401]|nr:MAG: Glucose-1-phosphate thymidylyltransferase [Planctomycetes bacterium ADurb.Bin401]
MNIKGIILAGGTGSRLMPLTKVTNKHLLAVGTKPMIYYPVEKLVSAGIDEILVVTGVDHMGHVVNLLGSGKDYNCRFTYKVQDQAGGIAQALALGENFANDGGVAVILGDNIFKSSLKPYLAKFDTQQTGARVLLKKVAHPQRFGVAEIKDDKVLKIVEKPKRPKTNYAVTGIYFYDNTVFEKIRKLKPSGRGELEITDVNNAYINSHQLKYDFLDGWWTDAGTFESLSTANELVLKDPPK